jgi:hypothetical protein
MPSVLFILNAVKRGETTAQEAVAGSSTPWMRISARSTPSRTRFEFASVGRIIYSADIRLLASENNA